MRPVIGASKRDPLSRLLVGTAGALRARQRLPARDPRRASSRWLRPNWPDAFLVGVHRRRLVDALMQDEALRQEVRNRLRLSVTAALGGDLTWPGSGDGTPADVSELLAAAIAAADDPVAVLESAATDPDSVVAAAAAPYLKGELSLPATEPRPAGRGGQPGASAADQSQKLRRRTREAEEAARSLRRQLRDQQKQTGELRCQLVAVTERAERAEALEADLRRQVPSRREREALASASSQDERVAELKRSLDRERTARRAESRQLRELVSEAETALGQAQEKLDAEARGRHKLEADLGNDAGRRAGRLIPLAVREAAELCQRADSMPDGPGKTRHLRRAGLLDALVASLRDLYALDAAGEPGAKAGTNGDTRGPKRALVEQVRSRGLTITPVGGVSHIGGSALLVEAAGTRVLVDAGLKPQAHISRPGPDHIEEAVRERLDAVVVTHAHADHAGFVPWVVERQRRAEVLCSPQTKALLPVVWADSVKVMRADADALATSRADHVEPPYGEAEVEQAEGRLVAAGYGQTATVGDLELTLFPAGHILGAAGVIIRAGDQRVVVTGDIDDRGQASVGPAQIPPGLAGGADLLVIETTYCDSIHRDRGQEGDDLVRQAGEVLDAGGRLLIPAFGLGRAQEVALLLGERLPDADVLVDGLARDISSLYARNGAPEVLRGRVRKVEHRGREISGFREGVIITTSGMLTGGAAIPWAQAVLPEPDSALFLCGHQDEEAPGRDLQELADADPERPRRVHLRDDQGRLVTVQVAASVHTYNLSAHADRNGLKAIVDQVRPQAVMLVHGERGPQAFFRARLNAARYPVADNRAPWDAETVIADTRLAPTRHAPRIRGRRGYRS